MKSHLKGMGGRFGKWYRTPFGEFHVLKIEKPTVNAPDVGTIRVLWWTLHYIMGEAKPER